MKLRKLKTLLMAVLLISSNVSQAQDCSTKLETAKGLLTECAQLLDESKAVIEAKDRTIELKDLAITKSQAQTAELYWQVEEANDKLSSPFRNPFVMTMVGVVIGAIVTSYVTRK
jgi:hypothetical protein